MSEFIDYYEILQVHPKADHEVIDKAYKALIFKHHPDRGGDAERARLLNLAYEVLSEPARRASYDMEYEERAGSHGGASAPGRTIEIVDIFIRSGWPDLSALHDDYVLTWVAYEAWVRGNTESAFVSALESLVERTSIVAGLPAAELVEPAAHAFPRAAGSYSFEATRLSLLIGELPRFDYVEFPKSVLDLYQEYLSIPTVKQSIPRLKEIGDAFYQTLGVFMYFVKKYHPLLAPEYGRVASTRFAVTPFNARANGRPLSERLTSMVALMSRSFSHSEWQAWANKYGELTPPDLSARSIVGNAFVAVGSIILGEEMA